MSITVPSLTLGTSLFCLTHEHHARKLDLAQQIEALGDRGLGPGLEIVGFQCLRGFPRVDPDFAAWFRNKVESHGLQPSCLDGEVDVAVRRDRNETEDEIVAAVEAQLRAAHALGFPVLRLQMLAGPRVIERCVPLAEKLGVALGVELDSFYAVDHPSVLTMRDLVERLSSLFVGFVPDFGASMRGIPPGMLRSFADRGVAPALLALAQEVWSEHRLPEHRMEALTHEAATLGASEADLAALRVPMTVCGAQDPSAWAEIAPYTRHVHAKFFEFDARGDEPSVDHQSALGALVRGGYQGTISSEWGGVMYTDAVSGLDMVAQHHALLRQLLPVA